MARPHSSSSKSQPARSCRGAENSLEAELKRLVSRDWRANSVTSGPQLEGSPPPPDLDPNLNCCFHFSSMGAKSIKKCLLVYFFFVLFYSTGNSSPPPSPSSRFGHLWRAPTNLRYQFHFFTQKIARLLSPDWRGSFLLGRHFQKFFELTRRHRETLVP